jgi:hypothetical protein
MAKAIEHPENIEDALNPRRMILIATMRMAVDSSNAIALLSESISYYENMNILVRSLVELAVNGAYLQFASDEEVLTYQTFDAIPVSKLIRYADGLSPSTFSKHISEERQSEFDALVDKVKQDTGKSDKDFGWTRIDLVTRCKRIDLQFGANAFELLGSGLVPIGHPFVHASYRSLSRYLPKPFDEQRLQDEIDQTLFMATQVLIVFAAFVNDIHKLNHADELSGIYRYIHIFASRLLLRVNQAVNPEPKSEFREQG